jgi:hypothetical protein
MRQLLRGMRDERAIREVLRRNTTIRRGARGQNILRLVIDHQSFTIGDPMSMEHAKFFARSLAIALIRFKAGGSDGSNDRLDGDRAKEEAMAEAEDR